MNLGRKYDSQKGRQGRLEPARNTPTKWWSGGRPLDRAALVDDMWRITLNTNVSTNLAKLLQDINPFFTFVAWQTKSVSGGTMADALLAYR